MRKLHPPDPAASKQHQDFNNVLLEMLDETMKELLAVVFQLDKSRTVRPPRPKKSHRTLAREPDLLLGVLGPAGEIAEIFHGELHLKDEAEIGWRMQEYAALEARRFRLPVRLNVLFIGRGKAKNIPRKLDCGDLQTRIRLRNIQDYHWRDFLRAGSATEVAWAILANFAGENRGQVVGEIFARVRALSVDNEELAKHFRRLEILSELRNLQPEITKTLEAMPITEIKLDYRKDFFYRKGVEIGREEGREEGREAGHEEGLNEAHKFAAFKMLDLGFEPEKIAGILDEPLVVILQFKAEWEASKTA